MMPMSFARLDHISRRVEWVFIVLMSILFVYALLTLPGITGGAHPFQPRRFAVLTGAMLQQPVAALLMRRSRSLGFPLLALSVAGLVGAFTMAS